MQWGHAPGISSAAARQARPSGKWRAARQSRTNPRPSQKPFSVKIRNTSMLSDTGRGHSPCTER
jgi:hypothetical protein